MIEKANQIEIAQQIGLNKKRVTAIKINRF